MWCWTKAGKGLYSEDKMSPCLLLVTTKQNINIRIFWLNCDIHFICKMSKKNKKKQFAPHKEPRMTTQMSKKQEQILPRKILELADVWLFFFFFFLLKDGLKQLNQRSKALVVKSLSDWVSSNCASASLKKTSSGLLWMSSYYPLSYYVAAIFWPMQSVYLSEW